MRAKRETIVIGIVVLFLSCCKPSTQQDAHQYSYEVLLPMTPVKNQGGHELCWAYAMLATIETEHLLRGDSVNLSPVFIGRMLPRYQAAFHLSRPTERAMGQTLLNVMGKYGVVGYDVLPDDAPNDLSTPKSVFLGGVRYTPQEFARSVCAPNEYIGLTSCPDSAYNQRIVVPIPDNWEHNRLWNVPKDTLKQRINRALRNRHPVCWESKAHAMCIIGMAHDEQRHTYYVMKNSWGSDQPHGGLVYVPTNRMWREMVALYLTRDAYEGK